MGLTKEEIRGRLRTYSAWVTTTRTVLVTTLAERRTRFIVAIWIKGNRQNADDIMFELLQEDSTYRTMFSPIPVGPADFRQIPEGSYDVEDPVLRIEGGEALYARVVGMSLNVTINFLDTEI